MDNEITTESNPESTQVLVKKYWSTVYSRCLRLLSVPSISRDVSVSTFGRVLREVDGSDIETGKMIDLLYGISTSLCLEKLSGARRRNTDWLRTLEKQKHSDTKNVPKAEQDRQNILDLIDMSRPENKRFILYRFLDGLDLASVATLCGISEQEAENRQKKFLEQANDFLRDKGLSPIAEPESGQCPDAFVMEHLSRGSETGFEGYIAHIEQHEPCKEKLEQMKKEHAQAPEDLAEIIEDVILASKRLSEEEALGKHEKSAKAFILPALVAALATGALIWALLPVTPRKHGSPADFLGYRLMLLKDSNGAEMEIRSGESVAPGENLGIMLSSPKPMSVRILSLGERGSPKSIMPPSVFSWPMTTSAPQKLPFSYKTDKTQGAERVFALFCPQESMLKYLEQGLDFAYPKGADGTRNLERDLQGAPPHCEMRSVLIKRKPKTMKVE